MKVRITGAAGFVGSVPMPLLIDDGHTVRVVDRGLFGLDYTAVVRAPRHLGRVHLW